MKKILLVLIAAVILGCSDGELKKVDKDVVAGLMICIVEKSCRGEVTGEAFGGETIVRVTKVTASQRLSFLFVNSERFSVSILNRATMEQVLIEDHDLDGYADRISLLVPGATSLLVFGREDMKHITRAQEMYFKAMQVAKEVVPREIQDAIIEQKRQEGRKAV